MLGLFSRLGYKHAEGYHISGNCNDELEMILHNILVEDSSLRPFRRSIGFGQNLEKDLIPLLLASKDDKTTELLIKILMNLTMPVECLLSSDIIAETDCDRHTIFELNNLLKSSKSKFTDRRVTKVVIDYLNKNADVGQSSKLSSDQILNIANCLLLLRNVLHIPDAPAVVKATTAKPKMTSASARATTAAAKSKAAAAKAMTEAAKAMTAAAKPSKAATQKFTLQNQIIWNIFSQSIDKILIKLMTIPEADSWCVSMVQLIELLYKDQHADTLQNLITVWLESSPIESSEENESNTSPANRGSDDSSPVVTSDPTSDSSDTQANAESQWRTPASPKPARTRHATKDDLKKKSSAKPPDTKKPTKSESAVIAKKIKEKPNVKATVVVSETQKENRESTSTSSNDEQPATKHVHHKPHSQKQRANSKATIRNVHGKMNVKPSDDDISQVLKEFTVDILFKGFNSLVQTLHSEILTNRKIQIETSHFFWLISYFLKFATQMELEMEQLNSVLTFEIVSYLTAESVNLCEQFELAIKLGSQDIEPLVRRQHLLVSAIREFFQAIDAFSRQVGMTLEDQHLLLALQERLSEMDELRSLFVLLLRHYNPKHQPKQYLQDLVVAHHNLIVFLEEIMSTPKFKCQTSLKEHIKQFASAEVMHKYGLVLEDYWSNGHYVNDCVFTLMHHVVGGGELDNMKALYQPNILMTFAAIWETECELGADWIDLIEYTINNFVKKPQSLQLNTRFNWKENTLREKRYRRRPKSGVKNNISYKAASDDKWSEEELSSLNWHYLQCESATDVVGEIVQLFKDEAVTKTRESVLKALNENNFISEELFEKCSLFEKHRLSKQSRTKDEQYDEIGKLCEQIIREGRGEFLSWLQMVLLETCFAKIYHEKCRKLIELRVNRNENCNEMSVEDSYDYSYENYNENCIENCNKNSREYINQYSIMNPNQFCNHKDKPNVANFELFKKMEVDCNFPLVSPVAGHFLMLNESVPVVPWTTEQAAICKDLKFLQLMHRLGFQMPVDTCKVFIRIPCVWSAEHLYQLAGKLGPINISKLKFAVKVQSTASTPSLFIKSRLSVDSDEFCQIHKLNRSSSGVEFKPPPPTSALHSDTNPYEEDMSQGWLDVLNRSNEFKISMNSKRELMEKYNELEPSNEHGREPVGDIATDCCSDFSEDRHHADRGATRLPPRESNDDMSVCGSASSEASNLTRMYVSDEED